MRDGEKKESGWGIPEERIETIREFIDIIRIGELFSAFQKVRQLDN
jgi:hypothetical protein